MSVLAASSLFEFQALALRRVYKNLRDLSSGGDSSPAWQEARDARNARGEAKQEVWERWRSDLLAEDQVRGHRAARSVLLNWKVWRNRSGLQTPVTTARRANFVWRGKFPAVSCDLPLARVWPPRHS